MPDGVHIRPALPEDGACPEVPDVLPDRWRPGGNRRSLVAVRGTEVLGHVRGIDNRFHPGSRVLVLEVHPGHRRQGIGTALCAAQLEVSDRPLHVKIYASMSAERALARRFAGIAVQATPPWRYEVTPQLRQWARGHRAAVQSPHASDAQELLDLSVRHYLDQHAAWSPADEGALREAFASDVVPGPEGYDPHRSTVLRRNGRIVAAALVWPHHPGPPMAGHEVSLMCTRHNDPAARADLEACLAGVIERSAEGAVLLVDSHATEPVESAMMRDVPGPEPYPVDEWMAIVALPVRGGPEPVAMPRGLLPARARWIEQDFLPA